MTGKFALVVHPDEELLHRAGESLSEAGFKVMTARSDDEARDRIGNFSLFMPDVLVSSFETTRGGHEGVLADLRSNPLTERIPVVVLVSDDGDERREALRAGFNHLVLPPHDGEELMLTTRLALDQHRDERLLSGSLEQLSVPELLQTAETARRSGTVVFKSHGHRATLWLRGGRIVDAEDDTGRRGKEAVFEIVHWEEGSFEADFGPISVPERISESTSFLLLEAMRRKDESRRDEENPPHAAMPDPPPQPPRQLRTVHRALTLVAVTASYASDHFTSELVEKRLEKARAELEGEHPILGWFRVSAGGQPALEHDIESDQIDVEAVVEGVSSWLRRFFGEAEAALPGRFEVRKLRQITEAVSEDLEELGFYQALGLSQEDVP